MNAKVFSVTKYNVTTLFKKKEFVSKKYSSNLLV